MLAYAERVILGLFKSLRGAALQISSGGTHEFSPNVCWFRGHQKFFGKKFEGYLSNESMLARREGMSRYFTI